LQLLAEDPEQRAAFTALIQGPAAKSFSPEGLLLAGTAALIALQSHLKIQRDKNGKWQFTFEAKPTPPALLKLLVEKLLAWFAAHPQTGD